MAQATMDRRFALRKKTGSFRMNCGIAIISQPPGEHFQQIGMERA
jgi:hypothetical protein